MSSEKVDTTAATAAAAVAEEAPIPAAAAVAEEAPKPAAAAVAEEVPKPAAAAVAEEAPIPAAAAVAEEAPKPAAAAVAEEAPKPAAAAVAEEAPIPTVEVPIEVPKEEEEGKTETSAPQGEDTQEHHDDQTAVEQKSESAAPIEEEEHDQFDDDEKDDLEDVDHVRHSEAKPEGGVLEATVSQLVVFETESQIDLKKKISEMQLGRVQSIDSYSLSSSLSSGGLKTPDPSAPAEVSRSKFFEDLGEVPNLSDIQLSDKVDMKKPEPKAPKAGGTFTDPLTGQVIKIEEPTQEIVEEEELYEDTEEPQDRAEQEDWSFDDFDRFYEELEVEEKKDVQQESEEDYMDIVISPQQAVMKIDFQDGQEIEDDGLLPEEREQIEEFLDEVIDQVVIYVDAEETTLMMRRTLDKTELFRSIEELLLDYAIETGARTFLSRKTSEYFRRRLLWRYITPDRSDMRMQDYERYIEVVEDLDRLLGVEVYLVETTSEKIAALEKEKLEFEQTVHMEWEAFSSLVKKTLKREDKPQLEEFVKRDLYKIKELSTEITEVRRRVIQHQHMLGTLKNEIDVLEDIGNGLRVADYEAMQRQAIAVGKKNEERNRDLGKMYERFHNSLHILAHWKVKNELSTKKMGILKGKMNAQSTMKNMCRLNVYELKKTRQKIKRLITEVTLQSGLLSKPTLLHDYDDTMELVERKRKANEELRQKQKTLELKIKQAEKMCKKK